MKPSKPQAITLRWHWTVVLMSATLMIASLTQIACIADNSAKIGVPDPFYISGWKLLVVGPAGVLMGAEILAWPTIIVAWIFACRKMFLTAAFAGVCAVYLMSTTDSVGYAAWLANPIIAVTWALYLRNKRFATLTSAIIALGLALSFLLLKAIPDGDKVWSASISSYAIGYWLWIAGIAIVAIGVSADMLLFRERIQKTAEVF